MSASLPSDELARLRSHKGAVHALCYSNGSSQYLLTGGSDRNIHLYNPSKAIAATTAAGDALSPPNAGLIQTYTGAHGYEVLSLAISTDNSQFVSGGGDKVVFLWDVSTGHTVRRFGGGPGGGGSTAMGSGSSVTSLGGHSGRVEAVSFAGEGDSVIVSGSFDATVRLWDVRNASSGNRPIMVLNEAKDGVSCLCVRGPLVWAGSTDGRVRGYDIRMGSCAVDVLGAPVTSVCAALQGDSVLVSTLDSTVRLLDAADGRCLRAYGGSDSTYTNTTYRMRSTLGQRDALVLAGSEDGAVYGWDVVSGAQVGRVQHVVGHNTGENGQAAGRSSRGVVSAVAYRQRGDEWASAGGDGTVVIWGHQSSL